MTAKVTCARTDAAIGSIRARSCSTTSRTARVWQGCAELRTARPLLPPVATEKQPLPASPYFFPAVLGLTWHSAGEIRGNDDVLA